MAIALKIKAKKDGYRRAGHGFSATEEKTIPVSKLSKEQIETLKADSNLLVSEVEIKAEKAEKTDGDTGGEKPFNRKEAIEFLASKSINVAKNISNDDLKAEVAKAQAA